MPSEILTAEQAIARFKENEERINKFVSEFGTYSTSEGVTVETLRSFLNRKNQELSTLLGEANNQTEEDDLFDAGCIIVVRLDLLGVTTTTTTNAPTTTVAPTTTTTTGATTTTTVAPTTTTAEPTTTTTAAATTTTAPTTTTAAPTTTTTTTTTAQPQIAPTSTIIMTIP